MKFSLKLSKTVSAIALVALGSTLPATSLLAQGTAAAPAAAATPAVKPFEVVKIAGAKDSTTGGIWYGRFGPTNCSWIDMGDGILVIDTSATVQDGANLAAQIRETTNGKPIKWFVLTHLHGDSNGGLNSFIPTDATIFTNARVAPTVSFALSDQGRAGKIPTVVGVADKIRVVSGKNMVELSVPKGNAHTDADLWVFSPQTGIAWVGDLVTPTRCPMMSDPNCDPAGWLTVLDELDSLGPKVMVPSRGDAAVSPALQKGVPDVTAEIFATRKYIKDVVTVLRDLKKKGAPEARVAGELATKKVGEYCPAQLDAVNAQGLYRRLGADGKFTAPPDPAAAGARPNTTTAKPPVKK